MTIFKQFIALASPYWLNRQHWFTWVILAVCIAANLFIVKVTVWLNTWNKSFFDALAALDTEAIYPLLFEFCGLIALIVVIKVYAKWLQQLAEIRWRTWLTEHMIERWMHHKVYYKLTLSNEPDNPDQRIAEDARLLTSDSIRLFIGAIKSVAVLIAFSHILWTLSGDFALPWFNDSTIQISGYLFWLVLIYSIFGTGITHYFGHQLHKLNYQMQRKEADFRASLLRKRDSAEQIALYNGEAVEKHQLKQGFQAIASNWTQLMNREKTLGFVVNTYHNIAHVVPFFAAIPALLMKTITIGGVFQVKMSFMKVYAAFSWFIHNYDDLTRWSATVTRINQFSDAMGETPPPATTEGKDLTCDQLSISTPAGQPLLNDVQLVVEPQSRLFITGSSGLGKSTLLRTFAGIWPFYSGTLTRPKNCMLLPQKPYLPNGSLRDCLIYPSTEHYDDGSLQQVLTTVGLSHLNHELNHSAQWQQRLSGGEQQKLSLARALLSRPETLILDEATSNLDEAAATALILSLQQSLPNSRLIMVSHQLHLQPLFTRHLDLNVFSTSAERTPALMAG